MDRNGNEQSWWRTRRVFAVGESEEIRAIASERFYATENNTKRRESRCLLLPVDGRCSSVSVVQ